MISNICHNIKGISSGLTSFSIFKNSNISLSRGDRGGDRAVEGENTTRRKVARTFSDMYTPLSLLYLSHLTNDKKGDVSETLPKAQRTRGLSSSFQSNLLGYSQVQTQILIELHLQNLDPAFTSKSQLNITSSTKLGIQNTKPSFSISTKIQLHNLCKTSAAKY